MSYSSILITLVLINRVLVFKLFFDHYQVSSVAEDQMAFTNDEDIFVSILHLSLVTA